jgi:dTDP-4-dehydrorhamnose 3,5-epimerase
MRTVSTPLTGVLIVESPVYADDRGFFSETFHADKFADLNLPSHFRQENHSRSSRHTLRGLHFQLTHPQGKLVRAVTGVIWDVVVDVRRSSPQFKQWFGTELRAGDGRQLYVPPGFAHGFVVLSDVADVAYQCTTVYDRTSDGGIAWNDPDIGIAWPLPAGALPLLSAKDAAAPTLAVAAVFP